MSWVVVQKQFHDLVVSTYGRGFYILDDITPLEQMAKEPTPIHRFDYSQPRPAFRLLERQRAFVNYALKAHAKGAGADRRLLDENGKMVREMNGQRRATV